MEGPKRIYFLHLQKYGICKDIYQLIKSYLNQDDKDILHRVHNSKKINKLPTKRWLYRQAERGYLGLIKWVYNIVQEIIHARVDIRKTHSNGFPLDAVVCAKAAQNGHLHVIQWARSVNCEWDTITCANAAKGGHLAVLQWAREHNCPWDRHTCTGAIRNGHLEILQWARRNGAPWDTQSYLDCAQHHRQIDVYIWIFMHY